MFPDSKDVEKCIIEIISHQLGICQKNMEGNISQRHVLGADSLDTVQIVIDLEEEFDIQIYDEDVDSLETVGDVKEYIEENA